jgi:hypothetical protein
MSRKFIYGLIDPRDGQLRYVGQSSVGMKRAKALHSAKCMSWQKSLRSKGLVEDVEVLEETEQLNDAEIFWIAYYKMIGANLTNLTDGGDGLKNASTETKMKLSKISKERWVKSEYRDAVISKLTGRVQSAETIEKRASRHRGRKNSDDTLTLMSKTRVDRRIGCKRVFHVNTGTTYSSIWDASQACGVSMVSISRVLKGEYASVKKQYFEWGK